MTLLPTLLAAIVPLFLLIAGGMALKRWTGILPLHHVPTVNGLVVNVTLPATIFTALVKAPAIPAVYARLPLAMFVTEMLLVALTLGAGRLFRFPAPTAGMMLLTGIFGNTIFLGYPLAQAILPHVFTAAVLIDQIGMMIPLFVLAPFIMQRFGTKGTGGDSQHPVWKTLLRRLLRSPILIAVGAGLVAHYARPFLPDVLHGVGATVLKTTAYLGQATTPLVLIALGVALKPREAASSPRVLLPCAFKMVLCPLVMWCICHALGLHGELLRVGVLQASMPSSVTSSLLSSQAGMDEHAAGGVVFATTLLALVTVPLMQLLPV